MIKPVVILTEEEIADATKVGVFRNEEAKRMGLKHKYGFRGEGEDNHIVGAIGEKALSKHLDIKWDRTVNTFKRFPDLGICLEVRTRTKDWYDLIVRDDDSDESLFVLVTGKPPNPAYRIHGFMRGYHAKRPEWRRAYGDRDPAFFPPQRYLSPVSEIRQAAGW